MARRATKTEEPYRPLKESLLRSVVQSTATATPPQPVEKDPEEKEPASQKVVPIPAENKPPSRPKPKPAPVKRKAPPTKKVILTREDQEFLEDLSTDLTRALGCPVKVANVLRATISMLRPANDQILKRAGDVSPLQRPPNDDPAGLVLFEHRIAQVFDLAHRETKPLNTSEN